MMTTPEQWAEMEESARAAERVAYALAYFYGKTASPELPHGHPGRAAE